MNNDENKNVENNDEQMEKKNHGRHHEPKFDPIGGIGKFVDDHKKWFIIGGCFAAGLLLGGAGTMLVAKGRQDVEAEIEQVENEAGF